MCWRDEEEGLWNPTRRELVGLCGALAFVVAAIIFTWLNRRFGWGFR